MDLVDPVGERFQHRFGFRRIGRFSHHSCAPNHDRIGRQNGTAGIPALGLGSPGLRPRDPQGVLARLLAGDRGFVHIGGENLERIAGRPEQLGSTRRL
jgi:hypothetical protein